MDAPTRTSPSAERIAAILAAFNKRAAELLTDRRPGSGLFPMSTGTVEPKITNEEWIVVRPMLLAGGYTVAEWENDSRLGDIIVLSTDPVRVSPTV